MSQYPGDSGPALAMIAEQHFHQVLDKEEGADAFKEFATKLSLEEWRAAAVYLDGHKPYGDLQVVELKDSIEILGDKNLIDKQMKESDELHSKHSWLAVPGVILAAGGAAVKVDGLSHWMMAFGAAFVTAGATEYFDSKPRVAKELNSLRDISIPKTDLNAVSNPRNIEQL